MANKRNHGIEYRSVYLKGAQKENLIALSLSARLETKLPSEESGYPMKAIASSDDH
jgi:hypothetical protein